MQRFETAVQLAKELRAFNREQGLPRDLIPAANVLRGADRQDLLSEVQRFGGAIILAPQISMRTQRGSGYASCAAAAKGLLTFAHKHNADSNIPRGFWGMPTQLQLSQAGRFDLLFAMTRYGQTNLAKAAGLKPNTRGRPKKSSPVQEGCQ